MEESERVELAHLVSIKLGIPLEHALKPGDFVLKTGHDEFSSSKNIIDFFTGSYYSTDLSSRDSLFQQYIQAYSFVGNDMTG